MLPRDAWPNCRHIVYCRCGFTGHMKLHRMLPLSSDRRHCRLHKLRLHQRHGFNNRRVTAADHTARDCSAHWCEQRALDGSTLHVISLQRCHYPSCNRCNWYGMQAGHLNGCGRSCT